MTKYAMLAAPFLIAGAIGCGPTETQIDITEYDRYCGEDNDCVLAIEGDVCGCTDEPAGINRKSLNRYRDDYSAALDACDSVTPCANTSVVEAFCDEGVCGTRAVE